MLALGKCQEPLMSQLGYEEERERNSYQWQVHSLIKHDYVSVTEIPILL
jgi:hypothetical protein